MTALIGNDNVLQQLRVAAKHKKMAHAYLICGAVGMGKKTLAKEICRLAMCESGGCDACRTCQKIEKDIHPDIQKLVGEGKSGQIKVDMIRSLRQDAYITPGEAEKKVYIIDGAENMNVDAQNALLKILEEPPKAVMFLLLCARPEALLPTVLSRVVRINLSPPPIEQAANRVSERSGADAAVCRQALEICDGNIGQALSLLQKENVEALVASCEKVCIALAKQRFYDLAVIFHKENEDSERFCKFCSMFCLYLRQLFRFVQTGEPPSAFSKSILQNQALFCTIKRDVLVRLIAALQRAITNRRGFISPVLIETQLVCICKEDHI